MFTEAFQNWNVVGQKRFQKKTQSIYHLDKRFIILAVMLRDINQIRDLLFNFPYLLEISSSLQHFLNL